MYPRLTAGQLGEPHFLAAVNNAAVNIDIECFVAIFSFL